ncbi:MAG: hypothetical protein HKP56_12720 [Anderseniella sp.]|nr:hypothetical protein [Anderseniella sp.]
MDYVVKGFTAGFIATLVVTAMMTIKTQLGLAPGLDFINLLAKVVEAPGQPLYGWLAHFAVGMVVWGGLFALASDLVTGPYIAKGISFGVAGWLLMMFLFFPLAGHSVFGSDLGGMVAVVSFGLHMILGLALGAAYHGLQGMDCRAENSN